MHLFLLASFLLLLVRHLLLLAWHLLLVQKQDCPGGVYDSRLRQLPLQLHPLHFRLSLGDDQLVGERRCNTRIMSMIMNIYENYQLSINCLDSTCFSNPLQERVVFSIHKVNMPLTGK